METMRSRVTVVLLATLVATAGCGGGGQLGDILGDVLGDTQPASGEVGQLVGEVQGVDTRDQLIDIRTDDGQRGQIEYDRNTVLTYRQQEYPMSSLERGDVVEMRLQEIGSGRYYTDRVIVRQSVQERQGSADGERLVQAAGTVTRIEHERGWFDLDTNEGMVTVTLPYNPPDEVVREFHRLSRGSRTSVEGYLVANDRIELRSFR